MNLSNLHYTVERNDGLSSLQLLAESKASGKINTLIIFSTIHPKMILVYGQSRAEIPLSKLQPCVKIARWDKHQWSTQRLTVCCHPNLEIQIFNSTDTSKTIPGTFLTAKRRLVVQHGPVISALQTLRQPFQIHRPTN